MVFVSLHPDTTGIRFTRNGGRRGGGTRRFNNSVVHAAARYSLQGPGRSPRMVALSIGRVYPKHISADQSEGVCVWPSCEGSSVEEGERSRSCQFGPGPGWAVAPGSASGSTCASVDSRPAH